LRAEFLKNARLIETVLIVYEIGNTETTLTDGLADFIAMANQDVSKQGLAVEAAPSVTGSWTHTARIGAVAFRSSPTLIVCGCLHTHFFTNLFSAIYAQVKYCIVKKLYFEWIGKANNKLSHRYKNFNHKDTKI